MSEEQTNMGHIPDPDSYPPRRLGRFVASFHFLEMECIETRILMAKIIVVDARANAAERVVEYTALCDAFDLVPTMGRIPWYDVLFTRDPDGGPPVVSFRKRTP